MTAWYKEQRTMKNKMNFLSLNC